jgi:hypothetical protein
MAQREIDIELAELSSATARDADNLVPRCSGIFQATSSWITKLAKSRYLREDRRRLEMQSILFTPKSSNGTADTY